MRKIISIFLLVTLIISLSGFQFSVEKCCAGIKMHFGINESCDMDCCEMGDASDCCDTTTIQKESSFLTYTNQELGQEILVPLVCCMIDSQILFVRNQISTQPNFEVHIYSPPERILFCTYRC